MAAANMLKEEEEEINGVMTISICKEALVRKVVELYQEICKLESVKPSRRVNSLLSELVGLCTLPCSAEVDVRLLNKDVQEMRRHLIELCAEAEGHLESHYARLLADLHPRSLSASSLSIFPYYDNYRKLAALEYTMLCKGMGMGMAMVVKRVAFVGSGALPLTSIVLGMHHLKSATFDNYDIDGSANAIASNLLRSHRDHIDLSLSRRMNFITRDILHVGGDQLGSYDVVFLAALVGVGREEKIKIVKHIARHMKSGGILMIRSAAGGRAFLYPIVEEEDIVTQSALKIISVLHPTNEVINSIILAHKP